MSLPAALHAALKPLEEKYKASLEDDEQIVMIKDQVIEECMKHKYAYEMVMHPKWMVGHPKNRGGEGLVWHRAHTRLSIIKKSGFSLPAIVNNSVGVEDHPVTKHIAKSMIEQCAVSDRYAKYKMEEIKGGTLGCLLYTSPSPRDRG